MGGFFEDCGGVRGLFGIGVEFDRDGWPCCSPVGSAVVVTVDRNGREVWLFESDDFLSPTTTSSLYGFCVLDFMRVKSTSFFSRAMLSCCVRFGLMSNFVWVVDVSGEVAVMVLRRFSEA